MPVASLSAPDRREALRLDREFTDIATGSSRVAASDEDIDKRILALSRRFPSLVFGNLMWMTPRHQTDILTQVESQRFALLLVIALELYRRQHETWPSSTEALVPQFIPSIPVDRLSGRPFQYRVENNRPVIFIVGHSSGGEEKVLWPPEGLR